MEVRVSKSLRMYTVVIWCILFKNLMSFSVPRMNNKVCSNFFFPVHESSGKVKLC